MSLSIKRLGIRLFNCSGVTTASFSYTAFTGEAYDEAMAGAHVRAKVFSGFDVVGETPSIYRGAQMKAISGLHEAFA